MIQSIEFFLAQIVLLQSLCLLLYNLQKQNILPKDIRFKTYAAASPKAGNTFYGYEYENSVAGGWGYNVINGADWVPELPFSVQTLNDFNETNPFKNVDGIFRKQNLLKRIALKLSKTCNDLRLLSSGPQVGLNEIRFPPRAAGASIMHGKVNPVMPVVVNQVAFVVIGNDMTITMAAEAGQLQLNAFEPIIAHSLFKSVEHLAAACRTLTQHCVRGITANLPLLAERVRTSAGLATALNPYIGYENATLVAKRALAENRPVADLVLELGLLDKETLARVLRPDVLTHPGLPD